MEFNKLNIDDEFTYQGWKFRKKGPTTALMLSNGQIKTFFEYMNIDEEPQEKKASSKD